METKCELCEHGKAHGWWGQSGITHCTGCHRTWSGLAEAHCTKCHEHFSGNTVADRHDKAGGGCYSRQSMERKGLRRVDTKWGKMWRGEPREGGWADARAS